MEGILGLQPRDEAAMLGVKTIKFDSLRIFVKMELTSQRREMLLFLTTNMAVVTPRATRNTKEYYFCQKCSLCTDPPSPQETSKKGVCDSPLLII